MVAHSPPEIMIIILDKKLDFTRNFNSLNPYFNKSSGCLSPREDEKTWHEPDEIVQALFTTKKGRHLTVTISGWKQMLMRGTKNYKMNHYPFTLLQITVRDEIGNTICQPMWQARHWFSP